MISKNNWRKASKCTTLQAPRLATSSAAQAELLLQLPSTASNATAFAEAAIVAVEPIQPKQKKSVNPRSRNAWPSRMPLDPNKSRAAPVAQRWPALAPSAQNARPICATPLTLQHPPRRCCKLEPSSPRSLRLRWPSPPLEFPPSITINCARETKMRVYVLGTLPCRKGHWDHMSAPWAHVSLSFSHGFSEIKVQH